MLLKNILHNNRLCDVHIVVNKIAKIGDNVQLSDPEVIDCKGKAILPAFANMHTHASMMFLRGIGEDKNLFDWLQNDIWPREAQLKAEHIYSLSRFAVLEMIKSGTTFFLDMYGDPEETIRAVSDMGIRAAIPYVGMDFFNPEETERRIVKAKSFLSQPAPSERIIKGLSCHAIYTCSEQVIRTFFDLSQEYDTFFHVHLSETQKEVDDCIEKYHCRPVELLNRWGILGPQTILAHGVHFNDEEIGLVADTKTVVAHCPTSNLKLGSGQMDLQKYWDKGVQVALGTDGVSSNNSLSLFSEMKVAALSAKNKSGQIISAKVSDVLDMATRVGFNAFQLNAGVIQEGALADFILVDLNNHSLLPNANLKSHLVYSADTSCVTDVLCDGKWVMKDGHIAKEHEIIEAFKQVCKELEK